MKKIDVTLQLYDEELEATSLELMYVPYDGFIDKIMEAFEDNNNRLIIGSAESCKASIPSLYDFIKTNDIFAVDSCLETMSPMYL